MEKKSMKKIYYILLSAILCVSCNDWLNVQPSTEIEKEKAVENLQGFRDILIGAYIRMKSENLYGRQLSWGSVEYLAQHWSYRRDQSVAHQLSEYKYYSNAAQTQLASICNNLYKAIADVNGILDVIEDKKELLHSGNYEIIKGEALAIRAFCHFDLLRLFGPMPGEEIPKNQILPYVKSVSRDINQHVNYEQFCEELLADLKQAETLLEKTDLITKYGLSDLNMVSSIPLKNNDSFFAYRQIRMNYYAVIAEKARIYLWLNKKEEALAHARKVIEAKDYKNKPIYRLGTKGDLETGNYALSCEFIFNLASHTLSEENWQRSFDNNFTTKARLNALYANTDIRFTNLWYDVLEQSTRQYRIRKYKQDTKNLPSWAKNAIPLIRLYEMYLIAMECSTLEEAAGIWNNNLAPSRDIEKVAKFNDKAQLDDLLIREYNREFYAEGQAFYAYKRLGRKNIMGTSKQGNAEVYVIPLPPQEFSGIAGL